MRITIFRRLLSMGVLYILSITILVCIGMFFFTRNAVLETIGHEARTVAALAPVARAIALRLAQIDSAVLPAF